MGMAPILPIGQIHRGVLLRIRARLIIAATEMTLLAALAGSAVARPRISQDSSPQQSVPPSTNANALNSVAQYGGLTVKDILFPDIPAHARVQDLLRLLPLKAGASLRREQLRESIRILFATRRFADVQVEAEAVGNHQVSLSVHTVPNFFIGEVTVEGEPSRPKASQVIDASKLQLGDLFTSAKVDRALKNIQQLMDENGYYRSSTTVQETKDQDTQQIAIVFHLRPGAQAHIGKVSVKGNRIYSATEIEDITKMHPGDTVNAERVSTALDRLRKKYQKQNHWLAQASISSRAYRSAANAVDFDFQIDPGPRVTITAEGFRLSRGILRQNVPVFEENAVDDDLLNEGRRNLVNYMQARGYFEARVTFSKHIAPSGDEVRIVYDVDAGALHKLEKVEIAGSSINNKGLPPEMLRSHMQVTPAGRFLSHGRYSQSLLNDDIRVLEDLYRANGFQQAKITSKVVDDYLGKRNVLAVFLSVNPGPQTLVSELHLIGQQAKLHDPFPVLNTQAGQPFSDSKVAEDREIILNYYFNHGFPNATFEASAKSVPNQPDREDVTFTIEEGQQVFVDQVLVSGLNFTRPFIVQRELQVKPGSPLSQDDMVKTQQRLYDLVIFSQVDTAVQNPDGVEPEKNVLVNVREARRYTFTYGGGFEFQTGQPEVNALKPLGGAGVSPLVSLQVTRLNFRGRDHTITFSSRVGRLQQRGLVSYEAPRWFNSAAWKLSITAFYDNTLDVTTFSSQRLEGSIQAEEAVSKGTTLDYRFTYRLVKASNVEISPNLIPLLSLPVRVGEPELTYVRDKRDNALESTKGSYTTFDGGVASSYFGSESDFSHGIVQNSTYHAFGKNRPREKRFVFARSTRIGLEDPFGNTVIVQPGQAAPSGANLIPLAERFFSGGGNSHRGFGLNQAGPRDPETGFPLGGSALFLNNLELRLPPVDLPFVQDNVSFALFDDAGNVFTDGNSMAHSFLQWRQKNPQLCLQQSTAAECNYDYISDAVGLGVRYKTPIGPVRFDFGYNLNPPAFPSFEVLSGATTSTFVPQHASHFNIYFSIGQSF